MGVFAGTERQCTEDEHDDETSTIPKFRNLGLNTVATSYNALGLDLSQWREDKTLFAWVFLPEGIKPAQAALIQWSRLSVGSSGLRWHGKSRQENEFTKVVAQ